MTIVSLPQAGGCTCGSLRYLLTAAPLLAYACHCHDCRKRSGSAFALTLVLNTGDFELTGDPDVIERTLHTGRQVRRSYCPECRAHLLSSAPGAPEFTSLKAGSLDDASWVVPISQSFVESAIPWAVIPGVKVVPWPEFDFHQQGERWRATAPDFRAAEGWL